LDVKVDFLFDFLLLVLIGPGDPGHVLQPLLSLQELNLSFQSVSELLFAIGIEKLLLFLLPGGEQLFNLFLLVLFLLDQDLSLIFLLIFAKLLLVFNLLLLLLGQHPLPHFGLLSRPQHLVLLLLLDPLRIFEYLLHLL
jgi:hypothetical protein